MAIDPYEGLDQQAAAGLSSSVWFLKRRNSLVRDAAQMIVNAGIAKEAYFRNFAANTNPFRYVGGTSGVARSDSYGLWDLMGLDNGGNIPSAAYDASDLWSTSRVSKGMFATSSFVTDTNYNERGAGNLSFTQRLAQFERYGFNFHYNPTTIQMAYGGVPDFDVTQFTSGQEAFNLFGTGATNSTISFNLVLNRVHDMKYLSAGSGLLKSGLDASRVFAGRAPEPKEQREIYNKGTMYDLEFLLRTVMGVPIESFLTERNTLWDGKTADIGFLTGIPVEVHLGKSLRYLVRLENMSLNHILFTERMVPMFTEVQITLSRIPDYAASLIPPAEVEEVPEDRGEFDWATAAQRSIDNGNFSIGGG